MTGQLDQITAPAYGRVVARQLPRSTLIEVPGVGHSPLIALGPCGVTLVRAFVDGTAAPPAPRCLVGRASADRRASSRSGRRPAMIAPGSQSA